ncbi:MAG TPA: ABC transporter ATP-binding protein [Gemmatimonadaceae bacterium]|nr:ABC transporter ATP-binding protein [Gemmatimonadaceae bacterium]
MTALSTTFAAPAEFAARPVMRPAPEVVVRVDALTKRFAVRRRWAEIVRHPRAITYATALDGVSLQVRRGELFGLLGPNGAGKTTLFKILSTLITPDGGQAVIDGCDVVRDAARVRRLLAPAIPEERSLSWRLTARQNLDVFAALHGLAGAAALRAVDEVLAATELLDTGTKMVGQFSSGMRQRLLIARALLGRPSVLLLDEPTRSLDPISARRFRTFLRDEIVGRRGCTVLLATHRAEEALELCDRVAVLDHGRVSAAGAPHELMRDIAGARFHVRIQAEHRAALCEVAQSSRGTVRVVERGEVDGEGWITDGVEIAAGTTGAAAFLGALNQRGVAVASFERVTLPLDELIERLVARGAGANADA